MQDSYGVAEVAASAGVTPRTMRHYDNVGLLVADRDPANGYRVYRRQHLLRLQRILLLKEMGVSLERIADLLDGDLDDTAALHGHLTELKRERDRLDRLIATVQRTLDTTGDQDRVEPSALFDGFAERRARFEARLVERFGDHVRRHFRSAEQAMRDWGTLEHQRAAAEGRHLLEAFERLRRAGTRADDPHVAPLVTAHWEAVRQYWDADESAYRALGDLLVDDPDQRGILDAIDPDLAPWLRDAVHAHTPPGESVGHMSG